MTDLPFTEADLRAAIPARCFQPSALRSSAYLVFDVALIALCYAGLAQGLAWYFEWSLIFIIGTLCWSLFVIGHEAGHGAFSKSRRLNTFIGILTHAPLLVPYRGWQRSHALHHAKTGHLQEEEVFRPVTRDDDTWFRKAVYRSGIFLVLGWPFYKLGIRNPSTYMPVTGSHYLPTSKLMTKSVRASWYLSLISVLGFLVLYIWLGMTFGLIFALKYIIAPYLIYAAWLSFVTYMQHVSPEVPVYDGGQWTRLKGAISTVDRNYGPFNWLTHNIGNLHVIHHIYPTIPHYRLQEATDAVRPILGDKYLSSDRFVLHDFWRTLTRCHHVEPVGDHYEWASAYRFINRAKPKV